MQYKCEARTVEGFVQQLAANYLPHGYWFYVTGVVPEGKDPRVVDAKLLSKYGVSLSRQTRARRKQNGLANLHYLRFERFWILLATKGEHPFFKLEGGNVRDVRKHSIQFSGYSITVKHGGFLRRLSPEEPPLADGKMRVRVQIGRARFRELKAYFLEQATRWPVERMGAELYRLPYEPYAPVRKQLLGLLRLVNSRRKAAGLAPISPDVLRYRRRIVRPFESVDSESLAAA